MPYKLYLSGCFCLPPQENRELYIRDAAGDGELWLLLPCLSSMTANLSHGRIALCIPRGWKCNQRVTCTQIDPNQYPVFERHILMRQVENTSRFEASLFPFDSSFGQIVSPCLQEWNHIKGLRGHCKRSWLKHDSQRCLKMLLSSVQLHNESILASLNEHIPRFSNLDLNKAAAFFPYRCCELPHCRADVWVRRAGAAEKRRTASANSH